MNDRIPIVFVLSIFVIGLGRAEAALPACDANASKDYGEALVLEKKIRTGIDECKALVGGGLVGSFVERLDQLQTSLNSVCESGIRKEQVAALKREFDQRVIEPRKKFRSLSSGLYELVEKAKEESNPKLAEQEFDKRLAEFQLLPGACREQFGDFAGRLNEHRAELAGIGQKDVPNQGDDPAKLARMADDSGSEDDPLALLEAAQEVRSALARCEFQGTKERVEGLPDGAEKKSLRKELWAAAKRETQAKQLFVDAVQARRQQDFGGAISLLEKSRTTTRCKRNKKRIDELLANLRKLQ